MHIYKLCLSLFSLLVISCVSGNSKGSVKIASNATIALPEGFEATILCYDSNYGTPGTCLNDGQDRQIFFKSFEKNKLSSIAENLNSTFSTEKRKKYATELFKAYCKNGRQELPMRQNVMVVLPQLPLNVPLDQAGQISNYLNSVAEVAVRSVFIQNPIRSAIIKSETFEANYYGIEDENRNLIDMLLKQKVRNIRPGKFKSNEKFLTFIDGDLLIIGWVEELQSFRLKPQRSISGNLTYSVDETTKPIKSVSEKFYRGDNVLVTERRPIFRLKQHGPYKLLTEVYFSDLFVLTQDFVLIENNVQGQPDISGSVSHSRASWSKYLNDNIRVESAQTDNPQILNYEASLDLNDFCVRARPAMTLLSN